jgi:signal transduction histidine kinase/CheY-like chemotaxis protein
VEIAPFPPDEDARIEALHASGLLDMEPDTAIDGIARLAAFICQTPLAFVSLVDSDRQWFKAGVGLDVSEISRDIAFCSHAILTDDLMIVPDAQADCRFADNPLVTGEPQIRFYAGAPFKDADGLALGTLCVIDRVPRKLTPEQHGALAILRDQVEAQLELRRRSQQLAIALEIADREIAARRITGNRLEASRAVVEQQAADLTEAEIGIRWLRQLTAAEATGRDGQVKRILEFACEVLRLEGGAFVRLEGEQLRIEQLAGRVNRDIKLGSVIDLADTEMLLAGTDGSASVYARIEDTPVSQSPVVRRFPMGAYMSSPVMVDDALYGYIALFGSEPKERPFTEHEVRFFKLIADWWSAYIVRDRAEKERDEAHRARADFLAQMSHEIRTPLHGVIGSVELLKLSSLNGEQRDLLASIDNSSRHLLDVVNQVLDFSRLEAGGFSLEAVPFDLEGLIRETLDIVRPGAMSKGLDLSSTFAGNVPSHLVGDPTRLKQVVLNIVSNAVKHTLKGKVTVNVTPAVEGEGVVLEVQDSGVGVSADRLDAIFEPFVQAEASSARRFGGTGLGLPISRHLLNLMGGSISATSTPGAGSTFTLTVPLPRAASPAPAAENPPLSDTAGRFSGRALVVDDNETNRKIAVLVLAKLGVSADTATSGPDAVEAVARIPYQVILMDIQMPGMDGIEATRLIRQVLGTGCPPIFAMTATLNPEERLACTRAGMPVLAKPFTIADVENALRSSILPPAARDPEHSDRVVDTERLALLRSLDEPGGPRLLELFQAEAVERISQLEAAAASADPVAVRRAAHSIKGLAGNVGALRVAAAAACAESSPGELTGRELARDLRAELDRFLATATSIAA